MSLYKLNSPAKKNIIPPNAVIKPIGNASNPEYMLIPPNKNINNPTINK